MAKLAKVPTLVQLMAAPLVAAVNHIMAGARRRLIRPHPTVHQPTAQGLINLLSLFLGTPNLLELMFPHIKDRHLTLRKRITGQRVVM